MEATCKTCQKEFHVPPSRSKAKFCSHKCQGLAKRRKPKRCEQCGSDFSPRRPESKYCSPECVTQSLVNSQEYSCTYCSNAVSKPANHASKNKFCSWECSNQWSKRNQAEAFCEVCGQTCHVSKSRQKDFSCCSKSCLEKLKTNRVEKLAYSTLQTANIHFVEQHEINNKFIVDAYLPNHRVVLQVDGDYWHGNPATYPEPTSMQKKNIARDKSSDAYLHKCGYKVVRIWESELKQNPQILVRKIKDVIDGHTKSKWESIPTDRNIDPV